ncbi:MAG: hypothetical protein HFJ09_06485 [Lachnospiraceae bacterium]|nr:hypothetical protein [Lachnospiraceae bacterium]
MLLKSINRFWKNGSVIISRNLGRYLYVICMLGLFGIAGCSNITKSKDSYQKNNSEDSSLKQNNLNEEREQLEKGYDLPIDDNERKEAERDCIKVMELISDIYKYAEKGDSSNVVLSEETVLKMQDKLKETRCPITAAVIYSNMENYKDMEDFLKKCQEKKSSKKVVYEIRSDGGINRMKYIFNGVDMYVLGTSAMWNKENKAKITYSSYTKIKEWRYTKKGWFCYELCVPELPEVSETVDGSYLVRVKPMNEQYREMSIKCVKGLGYQGHNLFNSNWDDKHMEELDYKGMYRYLYEMKYQKEFSDESYPEGIPKDEFECVIMEYLPVTAKQLQEYVTFDKKKQIYTWGEAGSFNYIPSFIGTSVPEVTKIKENKNGTVTLTVDAVCEMVLCDDAAITHELIIKFNKDGGFKYLGNKILENPARKIKAQDNKNNYLKFSISIDDFISCYNKYYWNDKGVHYLQPYSEWNSSVQSFGKHKGDIHSEFKTDKKVWTLPTITIYTAEGEDIAIILPVIYIIITK